MIEATGRELDTSSLSVLLRQAIGDMDERLATGLYRSQGDTWHDASSAEPETPEAGVTKCEICLAGATFARWGWDAGETTAPSEFPDTVQPALLALDRLRYGDVLGAQEKLRGGRYAWEEVPEALTDARDDIAGLRDEYAQRGSGLPPHYLADWHGQDRSFYVEMADTLEKHGI